VLIGFDLGGISVIILANEKRERKNILSSKTVVKQTGSWTGVCKVWIVSLVVKDALTGTQAGGRRQVPVLSVPGNVVYNNSNNICMCMCMY